MNIQYLVSNSQNHNILSQSRSTSPRPTSSGSSSTAISAEIPPLSRNVIQNPLRNFVSNTPPNLPLQTPQVPQTSTTEISLAAVFRPRGNYSGGKWKPYEDCALARQVIATDCARGKSGSARRSWSQVSSELEKAEPFPVRRSATACKSRFWWLAKAGKNHQEGNVRTVSVSAVPTISAIWYQHNQQAEEKQVRAAAEAYTQLEEIPLQNEEARSLPLLQEQDVLQDEVCVRGWGASGGTYFRGEGPQQRRGRMEYYRRSSISPSQRPPESALTAYGGESPPRLHLESTIQELIQDIDEHGGGEPDAPSGFGIQPIHSGSGTRIQPTLAAVDVMKRLLVELQEERLQRAQEHRELMGMLSGIIRNGG